MTIPSTTATTPSTLQPKRELTIERVAARLQLLKQVGPTKKSKRADKLSAEFIRVTDQFGGTWTLAPNTVVHHLVARWLADENRAGCVVAQEIIRAPQDLELWLVGPVWRRLEAAADVRPEMVIGYAQWDLFRRWAVEQLRAEGFLGESNDGDVQDSRGEYVERDHIDPPIQEREAPTTYINPF